MRKKKIPDPAKRKADREARSLVAIENVKVAGAEPLWPEHELAAFLRITVRKLQADRAAGRGVPYVKVGSAVRYEPATVRTWLAAQTVATGE